MDNGEMVEVDESQPEVEDTEDGGAIIRMEDNPTAAQSTAHFANIVEDLINPR